MEGSYFKIRGRFDFSPHPFEIGNPLIQSWHFNQNHVFKKIYSLAQEDYPAFYEYHLHYFLETRPQHQQSFYDHFCQITAGRIAYYEMQDPFSFRQKTYQSNIAKLQSFQGFLRSIDQWQVQKAPEYPEVLEQLIAEKSRVIQEQSEQITRLQQQIKAMREYETSEKINIVESHLGTFVDLIHQMQQLMLPVEQKRLFNGQGRSGWYKMLARYFLHGGKTIPIETARNYFSGEIGAESIKGTKIKNENKLFKISQIAPKK